MDSMSSYKNKNNKGVALILALGVSSVLFTLGMAYVGGAIQESNLSQRYQDSMASLYEAERGIAYAFVEAQNAGYEWFTSIADTGDADADGDTRELIPAGTLTTGDLLFGGSGATIASGNYNLPANISGATITVRAYADPLDQDVMFLMCRATVGSTTKIIKTKVLRSSLYKFLFFYPGSKYFYSGTYDCKNAGGLYVNG